MDNGQVGLNKEIGNESIYGNLNGTANTNGTDGLGMNAGAGLGLGAGMNTQTQGQTGATNQSMGGGSYGNVNMNQGMGPLQGGYGGMNMGMGMGMQGQPMNNMDAPQYTLWLVLGIVQALSLCCCNIFCFGTGLATILIAVKANNAFKMGNIPQYQKDINTAKIINLVGWGLLILGIIGQIFTGMFSAMAEIFM